LIYVYLESQTPLFSSVLGLSQSAAQIVAWVIVLQFEFGGDTTTAAGAIN
jgi:hypothetical protein